jgi:hypothetical protein
MEFVAKVVYSTCNDIIVSCSRVYKQKMDTFVFPDVEDVVSINKSVACQNATIRLGRSRRPRGPTYARGTVRSLFENQELARQRTAHDVATRPPCRNLFRDAHFEIIQFCLCRQSDHF